MQRIGLHQPHATQFVEKTERGAKYVQDSIRERPGAEHIKKKTATTDIHEVDMPDVQKLLQAVEVDDDGKGVPNQALVPLQIGAP